ncbi:MAG: ATP-binding protein [Polyangiaceae bacterium]
MDDSDVPSSRPNSFEELRLRAKRMDRNVHDFGRYARAAQTRAESMKASLSDGVRGENGAVSETAHALDLMSEELQVADEELREQNEELLQSRSRMELEKQRFRDLFDHAPDAYFVTDLFAAIDQANLAAARALHMDGSFLLGKPLTSFVAPNDRKRFRAAVLDLAHADCREEVQVQIHPRHGEPFVAAFTASTVRDDHRRASGIRWMMRDVTSDTRLAHLMDEHQRTLGALAAESDLRRQAEQTSLAKDEFFATISHELRTPLNAVLGWTQLLRTQDLEPDMRRQAVETIERNARLQTQLISDLLEVSRIITGKLRLASNPLELNTLISKAIEGLEPTAHAKSIRLTTSLESAEVSGDAGRLEQVVMNLLSNALKFTPTGGEVHVALQREGSWAKLTVRDSGEGIDPEFLPHVFERLRQADDATTRRHKGLGLGLAIVRHLVQLHDGRVEGASEGLGAGATFTVWLPLTDRIVSGGMRPSSIPPSTTELRGLRILVVDDEFDTRDSLRALLEQRGAVVVVVPTAREALARLDGGNLDLLLSAIGMVEEDGYSLIRKIRAGEASTGALLPAIALTARANLDSGKCALLAGFQLHVSKPVDPPSLVRAVLSVTANSVRARHL